MRYRTYEPETDKSVEHTDLKTAYQCRSDLWGAGVGQVAVQQFNDRFPQDGWRDVPYYQEHHLD